MRTHNTTLLAALSAIASVLSGCANPTEDRHIRLCKDIALNELGIAEESGWASVESDIRDGEAVVSVRPAPTSAEAYLVVSCFYRYDAVEDTALGLANPLDDYANSPHRISVGNRHLSRQEVARAIKDALLRQGGEALEDIKKRLRQQ